MPKKSNKTARVLNLLAGGTESGDELDFEQTSISKGNLPKEDAVPENSPTVNINVGQSYPWEEEAEKEIEEVMDQNWSLEEYIEDNYKMPEPAPVNQGARDIRIQPIEMKVEFENNQSAASASRFSHHEAKQFSDFIKPEVIVEVPNSEADARLSQIVRKKLEETLNAQISAKQEALNRNTDKMPASPGREHEQTPYSASFMSKFGNISKGESVNNPAVNIPKPVREEPPQAEPVSLRSSGEHGLYSEPYILEDFNDDDNNMKIVAMNRIKEHLKNNFLEENDMENESKKVIRNLAEELVKAKAPEIMKEMGMCTCEDCVLDVVAYTLNHIDPLYTATEKGQLFSKLASYEVQYGTDVSSTITKACLKVKLNPTHAKPIHTV